MESMNDTITILDEDFRQDYSQYQHESKYVLNIQELLAWGRVFSALYDRAEKLQSEIDNDIDEEKLSDLISGINVQIMCINNTIQRG